MPHTWSKSLRFAPLLTALACTGALPIPDEFDAAFTAGRVCMPSQVATGGVSTYPVRFEFCRYRCINVDKYASKIRAVWQCALGQCNMMLLATTHATRIDSEDKCDGRDLADPPSDECTPETFDFNVSLPSASDGVVKTGDFLITIPYLELEQADRISSRLDAGEPASLVLQEEAGDQNFPSRQFPVNFDATHAPVEHHDAIADSDCHNIPLP